MSHIIKLTEPYKLPKDHYIEAINPADKLTGNMVVTVRTGLNSRKYYLIECFESGKLYPPQ